MASSTSESTDRLEPADRLRQARAAVRSAVADPATAEPQVVSSPTPIKALSDEVGAIVVARAQAGLTPAGQDFPREAVLKRVALPSAGLVVLDLILLIVALIGGNGTLAAIAAVLLVVFAVATVAASRYAAADPLRIGPREQRAISSSGRWSPGRAWPEPGRHRNIVSTAAAAAQRIVDTPAWRTGLLARGGVVLSIAAELDLVERHATTTDEDDWERLITRVAALVAYADVVATLPAEDETAEPDPADVEVLAFFLSAAIYEVA